MGSGKFLGVVRVFCGNEKTRIARMLLGSC